MTTTRVPCALVLESGDDILTEAGDNFIKEGFSSLELFLESGDQFLLESGDILLTEELGCYVITADGVRVMHVGRRRFGQRSRGIRQITQV